MKYKTWWVILSFTLIVGIIIFSCSGPEEPTYGSKHPDPNPTGLSPAKIDSVSPNIGYLKDLVKIYGSGFSTEAENNFVSFGVKVAEVITATPTMLEVKAPNISGEDVNVKVAVKGSEYWSDEVGFSFLDALSVVDEEIVWPNGVAKMYISDQQTKE